MCPYFIYDQTRIHLPCLYEHVIVTAYPDPFICQIDVILDNNPAVVNFPHNEIDFRKTNPDILDIGFQVIPDQPHVFTCDKTEETGLVLPFLILQSDQLEDIPPLKLPFPLSWFLSFQKKMDGTP